MSNKFPKNVYKYFKQISNKFPKIFQKNVYKYFKKCTNISQNVPHTYIFIIYINLIIIY